MAIRFLSGQTIDGALSVTGNVQAATFNTLPIATGVNNVANQIVRTQANGYVDFGWINSISGNHTGSITRITASNDQYLRYVTPAQFRTGVTDGFYAPSSTVTGVTSVSAGNGLAGGTITSTGTLSTVHLPSFDTRNSNPDPEDYANLIRFDFKHNSTNGLSDGGTYNGQMTWRAYGSGSDMSGGLPIRLAYTASGNLWRQMGTSATAWGDWNKFALATGTSSQYIRGDGSIATFPTIPGGTVTSVATGNGLTGGTITSTGTLTMSGSYTGTFTATSLASNSFLNNAGSLLFSAGNTTTGASRSLNLRHTSGDPSSSDDSNSTGITWGQRTDSNPYYIIYPQLENWSSSGNYSKLTLAWHTGIKIGADKQYGGTRFYNQSPDISGAAVIMNVGVGNDNIGIVNALTVGGNVTMAGDLTVSGGDITLGGTGRIQGVDTVSASTDAANKAYVDAHPGSGGTVTSVATGNGLTGGTITSTGTLTMSGSYTGTFTTTDTIQGYGLTSQNKRGNSGKVPQGHYAGGETVWEMDNTWSSQQLADYFNASVSNVYWTQVADAPGGNCIYINGGVNVGGVYGSGFPYLPVETNSQQQADYYMEVWIQNVGTNQTHYMGSNEFNESFGSLGGNPGSYGYWVMSNSNPGTGWTKYSAYIGGFSSSTVGMFELGTKYWTPMALLNYGAGSGTRACRISGWKVIKVQRAAKINMSGNDIIKIGDLIGEVGLDIKVDNGTTNAITIDNVGSTTFSGYTYFPNYLFHTGDTNTRIGFTTGVVTIRGDSGITLDGPTTTDANFIGTTATFSGLTNLLGGSKIVVQNGTNGGAYRGIFMWTNTDSNWGIYMATPGATQNIAGGAAPSGLNGESSHSIRFRIASNSANGFIWENSANATLMSMNGNSGNLTTSASMRSPFFYDSTNTAYFGKFSSYSSMRGVAVRGDLGASNIDNQIFFYGTGGTTTSAIGFKNGGQFANPTGQGDGWNTLFTMDTANRGWVFRRGTGGTNFTSAFTSGWILNTGEWQSNTSMKSPIFYDSANTAYFGDFGGTYSNITKLKINANWGAASGVSPDDAQFQIRGTYPSMTFRSTNSNKMWLRHMDSAGQIQHYYAAGTDSTSWSIKHTMQIDGIFSSSASHRAPIFYDSNNTAYYGDFAGTSQLNVLNCAGTLTVTGAGGVIAPKFTDYNNGAFYLDPSSTGTSLNVAGDVVAYASSDIRFKNNITPITNALDKINKIGGYTFEWNEKSHKETGKKDIGVIAQEVEDILPEIVDTRDNGYKAVDYSKLTALLIQSVKEQQVIIDNLKSRIETLENN